MTFYTYMVRNYKNEDSPKGDLAKDIYGDKESFPRNGQGKWKARGNWIRDYLESCGACDACMEIYDECWEEYVLWKKAQLKKWQKG